MLCALRNFSVLHRRGVNYRHFFQSTQSRVAKNLHHKLPRRFELLEKFEKRVGVTASNFHTTRRLDIPPVLAMIIRPLVNVVAMVFGRYFKLWWARQSPEKREIYKKWIASKRGVFLGILGALLSGLGIYYVQHLETDPVTHRKRFILFNKQERDVLAKMIYELMLAEHRNNFVPVDHPAFRRIERVANNLLKSNKDILSGDDTEWTLQVINADEKNAFVLPGGHIFVFSGILKWIENDDQLAFILSHEMAHVLLQHPLESLSNGFIVELLLLFPLAAVWAMFPVFLAFLVPFLGKTVVTILLHLPYRRNLELEADEVGLNLAAKACVDVREAVAFWGMVKTLSEMNPDPANVPWLSTHPEDGEREQFLETKVPEALELRMKSGCLGVPRVDPRKRHSGRSLEEQRAFLKVRG